MRTEKKTHNKYSFKYNGSNHILRFGKFGIKAIAFNRISDKQLKSIEWDLLKKLKEVTNNKKTIKFWSLTTLNMTLTKLNQESRMGKGKGLIYSKAVFIKPGMVMFEFDKISYQQMIEVFNFIKRKVPIKIVLTTKWD